MSFTRWVCALLLLSALSWSADFKPAKLIEVSDATKVSAAEVANSTVPGEKTTSPLEAMVARTELTIALDGMSYSAVYPLDRHLNVADLTVGETIMARVEGKKLVLRTPTDGKELKAKIIRRAPLSDTKATE